MTVQGELDYKFLVLTTVAMAVSAGITPSTPSAAAPNSTTEQIGSNAGEVSAESMRSVRDRCQQLTEQTGEKHFYGEGILKSIVDLVLPTEGAMNPFDPNGFKGFIATFSSPQPLSGRTYIRATNVRFQDRVVELRRDRAYSFCYTIEREKFTAINNPETIQPIPEYAHE